jgi:hypothetical protein
MLSILAGSVSSLSSSSKIYGSITLDGHPRKGWTSRMVAYVPQFDFLLPTLTVAETLRYSALLRLPRGTSQDEVEVGFPALRPACVSSSWCTQLCPFFELSCSACCMLFSMLNISAC